MQLLEMKTGIINMENGLALLIKVKHTLTPWVNMDKYISDRNAYMCSPKGMYKFVHSNIYITCKMNKLWG